MEEAILEIEEIEALAKVFDLLAQFDFEDAKTTPDKDEH